MTVLRDDPTARGCVTIGLAALAGRRDIEALAAGLPDARTVVEPAPVLTALFERVSAVNAGLSISIVRTMREVYDTSMAQTSFVLIMLGWFYVLALIILGGAIVNSMTTLPCSDASSRSARL